MASDASLPLQAAIVKRLKTDVAMVAGRVLDAPAPGTPKPYISIGESQINPAIAQLYHGANERFQIDGWSAGPGKAEAKALGAAILAAFAEPLELANGAGHRVVYIEHEQTEYVREPDGVTQHAACIFTAATEPAS